MRRPRRRTRSDFPDSRRSRSSAKSAGASGGAAARTAATAFGQYARAVFGHWSKTAIEALLLGAGESRSILRPGRHGDRRAVAPSGKKAILQISIFDELGAQPDPAADQQRGDQEGEQIHRHAVAIIVAGLGALVFGEVVDRAVRLPNRRAAAAAGGRGRAR